MRTSLLTVARSIWSGDEDGTGLTGLLLGGVRRGSCSSTKTEDSISDSSASSGRRCLPLLQLLLLLGLLYAGVGGRLMWTGSSRYSGGGSWKWYGGDRRCMDGRGSGHRYTEGSVTGREVSGGISSCRFLNTTVSALRFSLPGRGDKLRPSDAAAATASKTGLTPEDDDAKRCW